MSDPYTPVHEASEALEKACLAAGVDFVLYLDFGRRTSTMRSQKADLRECINEIREMIEEDQ